MITMLDGYKKLGVFLLTIIGVALNYVCSVGIPVEIMMALITLSAAYILGQATVDGKKATAPISELTSMIATILKVEMEKTGFGKNIPMESIIDMIRTVIKQEVPITPAVVPTVLVVPVITPSVAEVPILAPPEVFTPEKSI